MNLRTKGGVFKVSKKKGKMEFTLRRDRRQAVDMETINAIRLSISSLIYQRLLTHSIAMAHIFTVERSSIFTFNKELSLNRQTMIDLIQDKLSETASDNSNLAKLISGNTNRYPLPIRQNLRFASDISEIKKTEGLFADFADEIESELLHGNHIDVDDDGNVSVQVAKGLAIPLRMAASVAKTLAPLILTLRHKAQPADLLIIDEPELNLHPAAQIAFARIMARMINRGLRLLISTHSDNIIRELNNMIMWNASGKPDNPVFRELGYTHDETLAAKDVGVYVFNYSGPKGMVEVKEVAVDKLGFEIESIDEAIRVLNESGDNAYASLSSAWD